MTEADPQPRQPPRPTHDDLTWVWESGPDEDYRRDMSHWRGQGRWADETWSAIGATSIAQLTAAAAMIGRTVPTGPLLEWGPGGGSNLAAFARTASRLYAADVSPTNLGECARVLAEIDPAPQFVPIVVGEDPTAVISAVTEPVELFVSTAVFQHFPSREYGALVLRTVRAMLAPGALGLVQIRYDDGSEKYRQKTSEDYRRQHVTYTSYAIGDFWELIAAVGLRPLAITGVDIAINYATFVFVAPGDLLEPPARIPHRLGNLRGRVAAAVRPRS